MDSMCAVSVMDDEKCRNEEVLSPTEEEICRRTLTIKALNHNWIGRGYAIIEQIIIRSKGYPEAARRLLFSSCRCTLLYLRDPRPEVDIKAANYNSLE